MLRIRGWGWICALLLLGATGFATGEESIPKHLQVARDIVANVRAEDNVYSNKPRYIRFPGDLFSSGYTVRTDCTGLTEAILDKAYNFTPHFSTRKFSNLYSIIDWVDGIDRGETFDRVKRVQDLKPGDFVMWKYIIYPSQNPLQVNGHILTVDSKPVRVEPQRAPGLPGMVQWEIWIIDSNTVPSSPDDTRFVKTGKLPEGTKWEDTQRSGAGRGRFYLYSNEEGELVATSVAFPKGRVWFQDVDRRMVMARVRYDSPKQ